MIVRHGCKSESSLFMKYMAAGLTLRAQGIPDAIRPKVRASPATLSSNAASILLRPNWSNASGTAKKKGT